MKSYGRFFYTFCTKQALIISRLIHFAQCASCFFRGRFGAINWYLDCTLALCTLQIIEGCPPVKKNIPICGVEPLATPPVSAHTEAGWMAGSGKRVIVYIPEMQEPELMYKLFDKVVDNLDDLVKCVV